MNTLYVHTSPIQIEIDFWYIGVLLGVQMFMTSQFTFTVNLTTHTSTCDPVNAIFGTTFQFFSSSNIAKKKPKQNRQKKKPK